MGEVQVKSNIPITLKDLEGYVYFCIYSNFKSGKKPHKFSQSNPFTIQNIKLWLRINNKNFELISNTYINAILKLKWKCLNEQCNNIWEASWNNIFKHRECPKCKRSNYDRTTESFKKEISELTNYDFEVKGKYINNSTMIKMYHQSCDVEFEVKPAIFLKTQVCPQCSKTGKQNTEMFKNTIYKEQTL